MIVEKSVTKDPICGSSIDTTTALHTQRGGKTFYFCSDACRQDFMQRPVTMKANGKPGGGLRWD